MAANSWIRAHEIQCRVAESVDGTTLVGLAALFPAYAQLVRKPGLLSQRFIRVYRKFVVEALVKLLIDAVVEEAKLQGWA